MIFPYEIASSFLKGIFNKKIVFSTHEIVEFLKIMIEFEEWRKRESGKLKLKRGSKEYYDFLSLIAEAVYSLNYFLSAFIAELERHFSKNANPELKKFSRFARFGNALVTINVKKYFFREIPAQAQNFPLLNLDRTLLEDAVSMYKNYKNFLKIKAEISQFLLFYYLVFSFVYKDGNTSLNIIEGVFPDFSLNFKLFSQTIQSFISLFDNIKNISNISELEKNLRKILKNSRAFAVYLALNQRENKKLEIKKNEFFWKLKPHTYKEFVKKAETYNNVALEPFSWWIAGCLRKLDGAIQDMDEFIDEKEKGKILKNMLQNILFSIKKFYEFMQSNYPVNLEEFKSSFSPIYIKMYEAFKNLINDVWEDVLIHRNPEEFYHWKENGFKGYINIVEKKENKESNFSLKGKLNEIYTERGEEGLKLKNLLGKLSQEELIALFYLFISNLKKKREFLENPETEFVGIYTSGVFLAHLVNVYLGLNKRVWLFKTYPHALTHPIHNDIKRAFNVALFDESVKTRFSVSIYENYLLRNTYVLEHKIKVFSLFDFKEYPKLPIKTNPEVYTAIKVGLGQIGFSVTDSEPDFNLKIPIIEKDSLMDLIKDFFRKKDKKDKGKKRINLYEILMDSKFLFSVSYIIAQKIKELGKTSIIILPYSLEGEILAFVTTLFLKDKGIEVCFVDEVLSQWEAIVGIDLSKDTGFTKNYKLQKLQFLKKMNFESLREFFVFEKEKGGKWLFLGNQI